MLLEVRQICLPIARRKRATWILIHKGLHILNTSRLPGIAICKWRRQALVSHGLPAWPDGKVHNKEESALVQHVEERHVVYLPVVTHPPLELRVGGVEVLLLVALDCWTGRMVETHDKVGEALPILDAGKFGLNHFWDWEVTAGDAAAGKLDGDPKVCQNRLVEARVV
jgi:hypothetical protein